MRPYTMPTIFKSQAVEECTAGEITGACLELRCERCGVIHHTSDPIDPIDLVQIQFDHATVVDHSGQA